MIKLADIHPGKLFLLLKDNLPQARKEAIQGQDLAVICAYNHLDDGDNSVGVPHGAVAAPLEQDRGNQVRALVTRLGQAVRGPLGPGEIHRVEPAMRSGISQSPDHSNVGN